MISIYKHALRLATALVCLLSFHNAEAQTYCNPSFSFGCSSSDYIRSFSTTGGITNISNPNTNCAISTGISTYLGMKVTANPGQTVNYSALNTPSFSEYYTIFVDWNQNGVLNDAGEQMTSFVSVTSGGTFSGSFTVPLTATPGTTRMRVMCVYATSSFVPCGTYSFGEIEDYSFEVMSPCPSKPTALLPTGISSMAATLNWTPVAGALKYDYVIDTMNAGSVHLPIASTTATTATVSGLVPGTSHYMRVRSYCAATSFSQWDTIRFTTLPACAVPKGFVASNVDSNSADIQWDTVSNMVQWQYIVDTNRNPPLLSNTGIQNTTTRFHHVTNLKEGRWQYVHIRVKCVMNDSSAWSLDSFYTPVPCRAPQLSLIDLRSYNAITAWPSVNTAYEYEYFLGTSSAQPSLGTPVKTTSMQLSSLQPKTTYDFFVRCKCRDNGILSMSGWSVLEFTTGVPTGISSVSNNIAVAIFPNPAKDVLNVEVTGSYTSNAMIYIIDVAGKTLKVVNVTDRKTAIDVKLLTGGVYFVKYVDGETTNITRFSKI